MCTQHCHRAQPKKEEPADPLDCKSAAQPEWAAISTTWLDNGSLYGVGIIDGVKSKLMGSNIARNRAMGAIQKRLNSFIAQNTKHYESDDGMISERHTGRFASGTLTGAEVVCVWSGDERHAALVALPWQGATSTLSR